MRNSPSISIIIPMFNEEGNAERCIDTVIEVIKKLPFKIKLLVVNDGSRDRTLEILKQKQSENKNYLTVVSYPKNRGYGKALRAGIKEALLNNSDYVLFMDSDLTNNPKDIILFLNKLPLKPDCVKASRYIKGGKMVGVPFRRRFISKIANSIAQFCFNMKIKDCTNGFRMVKLSKIKNISFKENSFSIIFEELYWLKRKNAIIIEVPVTLTSRKKTKTRFSYKPLTFYNYGKYAIKALFA